MVFMNDRLTKHKRQRSIQTYLGIQKQRTEHSRHRNVAIIRGKSWKNEYKYFRCTKTLGKCLNQVFHKRTQKYLDQFGCPRKRFLHANTERERIRRITIVDHSFFRLNKIFCNKRSIVHTSTHHSCYSQKKCQLNSSKSTKYIFEVMSIHIN